MSIQIILIALRNFGEVLLSSSGESSIAVIDVIRTSPRNTSFRPFMSSPFYENGIRQMVSCQNKIPPGGGIYAATLTLAILLLVRMQRVQALTRSPLVARAHCKFGDNRLIEARMLWLLFIVRLYILPHTVHILGI